MPLRLRGATSGYIELAAQDVATNNQVRIPNISGTLMVDSGMLALVGSLEFKNSQAIFWRNNANVNLGILALDSNNDFGYGVSGAFAGNHIWYTGGAERMLLDVNGSLGIGTAVPTAKLHVVAPSGDRAVNFDKGGSR